MESFEQSLIFQAYASLLMQIFKVIFNLRYF